MEKLKRFLIKNLKIDLYYKLSFIPQIISFLITATIFFLIDTFFSKEILKYIPKNINYFSYVFASFIIFNFSSGNSTIIQKINFDINCGVFEFIVNNEKNINAYIISLWLYSFIIGIFESIFYLSIFNILGLIKLNTNLVSLFILLFISSAVFSAFFFISSSGIILFRKGDALSFIIGTIESIFGGVYVPVNIFGKYEWISNLIPLTHSIKAAQKIIYQNYSIFDLKEFYYLIIFATILIPLSIYLFKTSIFISRRIGNISNF